MRPTSTTATLGGMTRRDYVRTDDTGAGVVVHWDAEVCAHSGVCVSTLPGVFNVRRRPWIDLDQADVEATITAVAGCPSGALTSTRLAAGEHAIPRPLAQVEEAASEPAAPGAATVSVKVLPNGPYLVKGEIEIVDGAGTVARRVGKVALCRCGRSKSKPFCDGSHHTTGFADPAVIKSE
jgi:uncharacterized Fe-S cluster protein YjdI/CDGSH-type Zn-finger protein